MTDDKQIMVDKILKLLELGKDDNGAHAGERESANNMAAKLMAKHSIDFAELRTGKSVNSIFEKFDMEMGKEPVDWEGSLAFLIGKAFDVTVVQHNQPWTLMYCGTKSDIEIAVFFFKYVRRSVGMLSSKTYSRKADQKTFAYGMVDIIGKRLNDLYVRRNAVMESDSRALMVVKTDGLDKFVRDQFPRLTKGKSTRLTGSAEAHRAGREAGQRVNLSRPIGHSGGSTKQVG